MSFLVWFRVCTELHFCYSHVYRWCCMGSWRIGRHVDTLCMWVIHIDVWPCTCTTIYSCLLWMNQEESEEVECLHTYKMVVVRCVWSHVIEREKYIFHSVGACCMRHHEALCKIEISIITFTIVKCNRVPWFDEYEQKNLCVRTYNTYSRLSISFCPWVYMFDCHSLHNIEFLHEFYYWRLFRYTPNTSFWNRVILWWTSAHNGHVLDVTICTKTRKKESQNLAPSYCKSVLQGIAYA